MRTDKYKQGLTLIEMVIVVGIVAILATMIISLTSRFDNQAKEKGLQNTFELLKGSLQEYKDFWGTFPDPNQSAYSTHSAALYGQLYSTPDSRKVLEGISESLIRKNPDNDLPQIYDPWGTVLEYFYTGGEAFPKLVSAGRDKIFNTADDISSR
ncbi:MAG: type II secretion system protein [Sedimentisphaerales bacterium]|nr:type II secretion system protein [Sedimentisphaerales bacterium]